MGSTRQAARFLTRMIDESLFSEMNVYQPHDIVCRRKNFNFLTLIIGYISGS